MVAQRRENHLKRLGQDDVDIRLHARKALRERSLHLPARNRLDAGADNLGHIRGVIQANAHETEHYRRNGHRRGRARGKLQKLRPHEVHEDDLHRQRRVLVELDIHAADGAQHARARGREHAQDRAEREGQDQTPDDHLQRDKEPVPKRIDRIKGDLPAPGIK